MSAPSNSRPFQFSLRTLLGIVLAAAVLVGVPVWLYHWRYPYGASHCCDVALMFALDAYARDHGGAYPAGEVTPEASLSLLYPKYADAELLAGKTVPEETSAAILKRGGRLGPNTCGWHYVEGLRINDNSRLAILWDKARLGHNGEQSAFTKVLMVNNYHENVRLSDWQEFLNEQKKLHKARSIGRKKAMVKARPGTP